MERGTYTESQWKLQKGRNLWLRKHEKCEHTPPKEEINSCQMGWWTAQGGFFLGIFDSLFLIHTFCLTVGLRVKTRCEIDLRVKSFTKLFPDLGGELRTTIRQDVLKDATEASKDNGRVANPHNSARP